MNHNLNQIEERLERDWQNRHLVYKTLAGMDIDTYRVMYTIGKKMEAFGIANKESEPTELTEKELHDAHTMCKAYAAMDMDTFKAMYHGSSVTYIVTHDADKEEVSKDKEEEVTVLKVAIWAVVAAVFIKMTFLFFDIVMAWLALKLM